MSLLSRTSIGLIAVGDDLATCIVRHSPMGVQRRDGPVLRRFLSLPIEEITRQLAEIRTPGAQVVLATSSAMSALRPIALTTRSWPKARAEVQRAVPSMFPLTAEDALLSLMDAAPKQPGGEPESGWLFATSRQRMDTWRAPIERAMGRSIDSIIPFHVALAATGLQHDEQATIVEASRGGVVRSNQFSYARPAALGVPVEDGDADPAVRVLTISDEASSATLTPSDLAFATAMAGLLAESGAMGAFSPYVGRARSSRSRMVVPLAGLGAAAALIVLGVVLGNARYTRATETANTERESIAAQAKLVEEQRDRHAKLTARIKLFNELSPDAQPRLLPLLAAAQQAVPAEGFLYRIDVDPQTVTIRGEAPRTLDVLARLEAAPAFRAAESLEPPAVIKERSLESFHIRARRDTAHTQHAEVTP